MRLTTNQRLIFVSGEYIQEIITLNDGVTEDATLDCMWYASTNYLCSPWEAIYAMKKVLKVFDWFPFFHSFYQSSISNGPNLEALSAVSEASSLRFFYLFKKSKKKQGLVFLFLIFFSFQKQLTLILTKILRCIKMCWKLNDALIVSKF